MYPYHASRLSVTICPIKIPLFKMRCFMPESYNVLKICLEVIVAIIASLIMFSGYICMRHTHLYARQLFFRFRPRARNSCPVTHGHVFRKDHKFRLTPGIVNLTENNSPQSFNRNIYFFRKRILRYKQN